MVTGPKTGGHTAKKRRRQDTLPNKQTNNKRLYSGKFGEAQ